jgi:hypothetical protein
MSRVITSTVEGRCVIAAYSSNGQEPGSDKFEYTHDLRPRGQRRNRRGPHSALAFARGSGPIQVDHAGLPGHHGAQDLGLAAPEVQASARPRQHRCHPPAGLE